MSFFKLSILVVACILSANVIAQFDPGITIATNAHDVIEIRALDMNDDQHLDIVVQQPSAIAWLENDGDGNFGALDTIYVSQGELGPFDFAVTQDNGGMDLVISDVEADTVLLLVNDGAGNFGAPIGLLGTESRVALNLANVTGSDLPDLVIHFDDGVYVLENGSGIFGSAELLGFGSTLIRPQYVCDIDDDDDLDIVCFVGLSATITFLVNPGQTVDPWMEVSGFPLVYTNNLRLLDVDGDGVQDLIEVGSITRWVAFDLDNVTIYNYDGAGSGYYFRKGWAAQLGCGTGASMLWTDSIGEPVQWATYDPVLGDFGPANVLPDLPSFSMMRNGDMDGDGNEDLILWHDDSVLTWHRNVLVVDSLPALNLDPFCYTGLPFISYELPAPGSWSGPGVIEGEFWAHTAGLGPHELVRTVDQGSGCVVSTSELVMVISDPVVEPDFIDVCTTGVVQFTADQPGGVWIGTSAAGSLDTDTLERPAYHSAQYRITDPAGATCSGSTVFNLFQIGHAIVSPHGPYCESDPPQQFSVVGGGLLGGVFVENVPFLEVEVVTNYANSVIFDPSIGPGDYSFTVGMTAPMVCGQIDTITIHVDAAIPAFELLPFDTLCASAVDFPLGEGPISGSTWTGDGVANGLFTPVGPFTDGFTDVRLLYSAVAGACAAEVETSIAVGGPVIDTLGWVESLCGNAEPIQFVASPSGGSWAAPLDASGTLDPSTVTGTMPVGINVAYTYTDNTGASCVESLELITIEPVPDVTVNFSVLCSNDAAVELGGQGSPAGGWYFIDDPAAPLSELDPIVLTDSAYVLSYVYTDSFTGCTDTAATDFTVEICLNIGASIKHSLQVFPNPSKDGIFRITGQLPGTHLLLYDATGRVLWQRRAVGGNIPVEITGLATGLYRLVAKGVEGVQAIGVVVE